MVLPLSEKHFDVSAVLYIIRYHRKPIIVSETCDRCGDKEFNIDHALCWFSNLLLVLCETAEA